MKNGEFCNDYGDAPLCRKVPDERYTMRFDDIGEAPILWCAYCGPIAHFQQACIEKRIAAEPEFVSELSDAIDECIAARVPQ